MVAEPPVASGVIRLLVEMVTAVNLYDEPLLQTDEVHDVRADRPSPAELVACESSAAERLPEAEFGVGGAFAE